ncbi:MAG: hypothetical protein ACRELY_30860 [Polyangiaceae bacterium]
MPKKSKRSRGGKKKIRASQAPGSQAPSSQRSGPERPRARASEGILPPPGENPDEISIPPVTSSPPLAADLEDSFFVRRASVEKAAAAQARLEHEQEEAELRRSLDPRSLQKMTAEAKARRKYLQRYVRWSVGAAAAIVALAVIRVGTRGKPIIDPPPPIVHTAMAATLPQEGQHEIQGQPAGGSFAGASQAPAPQAGAAQPQDPATQPAQDPATQAATNEAVAQNVPAAQPTPEAPVAAQAAAPVADTKPADPPAAAAPASDAPAKSALEEKKDASRLLERGKTKDAIAAGERSVALDPTDGEAWLVLGAAYQQIGKNTDAHRCFTSCIKEGKHGPISECREMLQ